MNYSEILSLDAGEHFAVSAHGNYIIFDLGRPTLWFIICAALFLLWTLSLKIPATRKFRFIFAVPPAAAFSLMLPWAFHFFLLTGLLVFAQKKTENFFNLLIKACFFILCLFFFFHFPPHTTLGLVDVDHGETSYFSVPSPFVVDRLSVSPDGKTAVIVSSLPFSIGVADVVSIVNSVRSRRHIFLSSRESPSVLQPLDQSILMLKNGKIKEWLGTGEWLDTGLTDMKLIDCWNEEAFQPHEEGLYGYDLIAHRKFFIDYAWNAGSFFRMQYQFLCSPDHSTCIILIRQGRTGMLVFRGSNPHFLGFQRIGRFEGYAAPRETWFTGRQLVLGNRVIDVLSASVIPHRAINFSKYLQYPGNKPYMAVPDEGGAESALKVFRVSD